MFAFLPKAFLVFTPQFIRMNTRTIFSLLLILLVSGSLSFGQAETAPFVYGDLLPDAPELSARGSHAVGVQTLQLLDKDRLDVLNYEKGKDSLYDRPLTVEIWYPATLTGGQKEWVTYDEVMGNANSKDRPVIPFTFVGRACRDAKPDKSKGPYPLVIVSHGYTGSRLMFSYLTENLASKGYVVVSIDHTESTYRDANGFNSTLLNRSLDDLFVLNEVARLEESADSFLAGLVKADLTALIGYSMGGYGAINVVGAGYSAQATGFFAGMSNGSQALQQRMTGNAAYEASMDARIKAVVAFAPWGMARGVWDAEGLAGLRVPTFFVAGSKDDVSGYENGIKAIYEGAVNADRYLLTYVNARHNVAPNPPPPESLQPGLHLDEYLRYAEPAWNERRINNLNQHFVTAFIGMHLKQKEEYRKFLTIEPGTEDWPGFKPRTSVGMELIHENAEEDK